MFAPSRTKFKKFFRGKLKGQEYRASKLAFGTVGIKALKTGRVSAAQIEAVRKLIIKKLKNKSKIWIRIYPHLGVTAKPTEVRMGKGKGGIAYWCCPVKAGRILFELSDVNSLVSQEIIRIMRYKFSLPVKLTYL
jgi:large subunit ribosomal protein L16